MKPLDSVCDDSFCYCHVARNEANIYDLHAEYNAYEWVSILAGLFIEKLEPIARQGGRAEYSGALDSLWSAICTMRGLTPVFVIAETVEETERRETSTTPQRKPIGPAQRLRIYKRDRYECVSCKSREDLTLDHIQPVSRGGSNEDENLQTLCRSCNSKKGVSEWPLNGQLRR